MSLQTKTNQLKSQLVPQSVSQSVSQLGHSESGAGLSFGVSVRLNKLKTLSGQRNKFLFKKDGLSRQESSLGFA
jgi:hypothetical protein